MAVLVQEMVQSDVAGVLFTCDPVSGDPTRLVINANYGLGEVRESIIFTGKRVERNIRVHLNHTSRVCMTTWHRILSRRSNGPACHYIPPLDVRMLCIRRHALRRSLYLHVSFGTTGTGIPGSSKQYLSFKYINYALLNAQSLVTSFASPPD